ncbi:MAG: metallophosphoesterase, partial [Thermodesulfobacteriota bacterium]
LAVMSDPHLPGRIMAAKEKLMADLNSWSGLDRVTVLGDVCQTVGSAKEYVEVKRFFGRLQKPLWPIVGNHDYIYSDEVTSIGRKLKALPQERKDKLERFRQTFNIPEVYYAQTLAGYRLIFLSPDDLTTSQLTRISDDQVKWLAVELSRHKDQPTIIFFHGPLDGTYRFAGQVSHDANYMAQPGQDLDELLSQNRQVFLWVSGHVHLAPMHPDFMSPLNLYQGRVTNIHTPDCDGRSNYSADDAKLTVHDHTWTNHLFFRPDRVEVKTFSHKDQAWLDKFNRVFPRPKP